MLLYLVALFVPFAFIVAGYWMLLDWIETLDESLGDMADVE